MAQGAVRDVIGYACVFFFFFSSNVRFVNCVDPFHEVKSKREKKKEVHASFCFCLFQLFRIGFVLS